jgi:hypothetical protein
MQQHACRKSNVSYNQVRFLRITSFDFERDYGTNFFSLC